MSPGSETLLKKGQSAIGSSNLRAFFNFSGRPGKFSETMAGCVQEGVNLISQTRSVWNKFGQNGCSLGGKFSGGL